MALRCHHDLDDDEALAIYMAALGALFSKTEADLGHGPLLSLEDS
ncbi:MAG: hypothetical protein ACE5I9_12835 [Candidatus Methylomirabilales bacterium]